MNQRIIIDEKYYQWKWEHGIPPEPYNEIQGKFFTEIIKEMNLKPFDIEISVLPELSSGSIQLRSIELIESEQKPYFKRIKFPGGIIGPHFHFDGKIFLLDEKQWHTFTNNVVKVFQERLGNVGIINMKQFAKLNETLTTL